MASVVISARSQAPHYYTGSQQVVTGKPWFMAKPAAVVRARSIEATTLRRPASVGRGPGVASPTLSQRGISAAVASPPHSHRSVRAPADPTGMHSAQRPQASRYTSRSPPLQRSQSGTIPRSTHPESVCVSVSPTCAPQTPAHAMRVSRSTSVPTTQSLGSAGSLRRPSVHASAPPTQAAVPAMPSVRAHSAGVLPVSVEVMRSMGTANTSPAISSTPTLTVPGSSSPPWAQVIQPHTARYAHETDTVQEVKEKQDQIYQTVQQKAHLDELKHATQQRVQTLENTVQSKEKELREVEENLRAQLADKDNLRGQLADVQDRLLEEQQQHAQAIQKIEDKQEDNNRLHQDLMRARHEYDDVELTNANLLSQIQGWERMEQEWQEKHRMMSGMKTSLEAQAQDREHEMAGRLAAATDAARRQEGEKRMLEAELEKVRNQMKESERETRELRCHNAVLEDELRSTHEQNQRLEQEQANAVQNALQDSSEWHQKFMEMKRENGQLQKAAQELKAIVWELESQVQQNRVHNCTPGELLKLAKVHERESAAVEDNKLMLLLKRRSTDLALCFKKIQEQEALIKELQHTRACQKAYAGA